jgi:selenocysteine-specific elongation factor
VKEVLSLSADEREVLLEYLSYRGELQRIGENVYFDTAAYHRCLEILKDHFGNEKTITLGQYRDLIKSSRRSAQALLEHFDGCKYTRRVGDERVAWKM